MALIMTNADLIWAVYNNIVRGTFISQHSDQLSILVDNSDRIIIIIILLHATICCDTLQFDFIVVYVPKWFQH